MRLKKLKINHYLNYMVIGLLTIVFNKLEKKLDYFKV